MTASLQRQHMVLSQIYTNDVIDPRILNAMAEIPREPFLPEHLRAAAYVDRDLEVTPGRFLMQPLAFAMLLELTAIAPTARVLNIGCLNGYTTAVLSRLAAHVTGVDIDGQLIEQAQAHMQRLSIANTSFYKVPSLIDGYAPAAPYDAIVIAGAVAFLPDSLGAQLSQTGRLVTVRNVSTRPGVQGGLGKGLLVEKIDQRLQYREHFDASAMLLPGFERDGGFAF